MRALYFDCTAGISGDMCLGAFLDLGMPLDHLENELNKLHVPGWTLDVRRDARKGITGTKATVNCGEEVPFHTHEDQRPHDASPRGPRHEEHHHHRHDSHSSLGHPGHDHQHHHGHTHDHAHVHRAHKDIKALIVSSTLSAAIKDKALLIFQKLAEAEAHVHGRSVDEVAFHEVGAVDSIIDIVGTAICLDYFNPGRIYSGRVELGGGTVKCAHGVLPVPAPATAELVKGMKVSLGAVQKEMTTPTGAAILAACVNAFDDTLAWTPEKTGYGIGQRDTEIPNVLRITLGEESQSQESQPWLSGRVVVLETNVDDMRGEEVGFLLERLLSEGALDAFCVPCTTKKSRPGLLLTVIGDTAQADKLTDLLFRHSTTLGIRRRSTERSYLARTEEKVECPGGPVSIKRAFYGGQVLRSKAEFDDLKRLAEERGLSLQEICRELGL